MTVSELKTAINNILDEDYSLASLNMYDEVDNRISCIYLRNGEVVLQSNAIENNSCDDDEYLFSASFALHCLNFFNDDLEVCYMYCNANNYASFYDIDYVYTDGDNVCLNTVER